MKLILSKAGCGCVGFVVEGSGEETEDGRLEVKMFVISRCDDDRDDTPGSISFFERKVSVGKVLTEKENMEWFGKINKRLGKADRAVEAGFAIQSLLKDL